MTPREILAAKGVSLERLQSFLRVADAGGFALAAPGNSITQTQLNRQVGELERGLGTSLIERRGRGVALTAAGEKLAILVREMRTTLVDVVREGSDAAVPFSFGAGDSLLQWWVVPRVGSVADRVPRAVPTLVSLASRDIVERLRDARLDFGLVRAGEVPKGLKSRSLGVLSYALYVPAALLPKPRPRDPGELLSTLPLALQQSEPELNEAIERLCNKFGGPRIALACETFPQACRALRSGHYAALLPTISSIDLPAVGVEALKLPTLGDLSARIHLAWHARTERRHARYVEIACALEGCLTLVK